MLESLEQAKYDAISKDAAASAAAVASLSDEAKLLRTEALSQKSRADKAEALLTEDALRKNAVVKKLVAASSEVALAQISASEKLAKSAQVLIANIYHVLYYRSLNHSIYLCGV